MSENLAAPPETLLLDPEFARHPYGLYDILLADNRVYRSPQLEYWFVSGYEEVKTVLMDPISYSSAGWDELYLAQLPPQRVAELGHLLRHFAFPTLVAADPPVHSRLRKLVHRAFTPRSVASLRGAIQDTVDRLITDALAAGDLDILRDLAIPLPVSIFAQMFGIPPSSHNMLKATSADFTRFVSNVRPDLDEARRADASLGAFRAFLLDTLEARRADPRDDLVTILVSRDLDDDVLENEELLSLCAHLLIAGHETTTNLITNGLLALLTHPDQLAALRADRSLYGAAIEEMLRWETPLQRVKRMTTTRVELGGERIEAGERLMLLIGAANRDPQAFERPEEFDCTRPRAAHLALGHGIHFCLGAALARLEAEIAISTVVNRIPQLRLHDDWTPTWNPSLLRGLAALPVRT